MTVCVLDCRRHYLVTSKGNFVYKIISAMVSFVPVTPKWLRQYIHEDDVCDLVALLAFDGKVNHKYEVFNICPPRGCCARA